jgi:hypothetical protein
MVKLLAPNMLLRTSDDIVRGYDFGESHTVQGDSSEEESSKCVSEVISIIEIVRRIKVFHISMYLLLLMSSRKAITVKT